VTDPRQCAGRGAAATVVAAALIAGGLAAQTAAADPVYPSQEQVDGAREAADGKAAEIGAIESRLAQASADLEQSRIAAATAAEDYNEAEAELERRSQAARTARAAADDARAKAAQARVEIGRLAATSYRTGGSLGGLEAFLSSGGPQEVLDRASALDNLGGQRQQAYQRMDAMQTVAKLLDEQAQAAEAAQAEAAKAADRARAAAAAAQASAQSEVDRVAATRSALLAQLAALRQTTVALEQERQQGLEAERQAREEEAARQAAAAREAAAARQAEAARQAAARAPARQSAPGSRSGQPVAPPAPARSAGRAPSLAPPAAPPPGHSSGSSSSGQAALDWARTQIGKPYAWGATGPDSYDCSGLTMRAWQRAGVSLPRTSRSQYAAVSKIPYSQLRPGDLVFYGDGSNTSSIYHVAIYAGGGQMVEAPSAGKPVREVALRMSGTMDFAGRP
jgi:peptidoglycan DL-endopeptidase CwlO